VSAWSKWDEVGLNAGGKKSLPNFQSASGTVLLSPCWNRQWDVFPLDYYWSLSLKCTAFFMWNCCSTSRPTKRETHTEQSMWLFFLSWDNSVYFQLFSRFYISFILKYMKNEFNSTGVKLLTGWAFSWFAKCCSWNGSLG